MALLGFLIKPFANFVAKKNQSDSINALAIQDKILINLLENAKNTVFGKEYQFNKIKNYTDFDAQIPVNDYEGLRHYIDTIIEGESDILWKGLP